MPRQSGRFVRHVSFRQTVGGAICAATWWLSLIGAAVGAGFLYWFVNMDMGFDFGGVTGSNILASNVLQPGATSGMALLMGDTVHVLLCPHHTWRH